jgi:glutaredoxin
MEHLNIQLFTYPRCIGSQRAKHYFQQSGILFEEIDLSHDSLKMLESIKGQLIASPLIKIGSHILYGFESERFEKIYSYERSKKNG